MAASDDPEHGVMTLFHLAELPEHLATSQRLGAGWWGKVSDINRNDDDGIQPGITRSVVGRPGLDPGTLGLKVPCSSG